ncbi:MAG: (2Fe-2S)-binding protein [Myxococcota bacterium]
MTSHKLSINGAEHVVEVPSDMPLLWVLRDQLGLTGTKFGCGIGQCRVCTVHVDGVAVPSCQLPVSDAAGKALTTIEGLATDGRHPVQQAWIDEQVPQCGYCQSGQIMGAVALLAANPRPSEAEVDAAMRAYVCRCGTYNRIRRAILRASEAER